MAKVTVVSVVDAVTKDLRARVLDGSLVPGTAMAEVEVAAYYDVARPTAKAAIENLVRDRLLERQAHKTARVPHLSPDDVRDIYRARELLESQVLRELARRRLVPQAARDANRRIAALVDASPREVVEPDMLFHTALVDALESSRTSRMYGTLASEVVFCMSQVQGAALLPTPEIAAEHDGILAALADADGEEAARLLAAHLGRARERLASRLADG